MLERLKRRIASERASVYLEYAIVSSIMLVVAVTLLNPSGWFFRGLGLDYAFREFLIKSPFF